MLKYQDIEIAAVVNVKEEQVGKLSGLWSNVMAYTWNKLLNLFFII